MIDEELICVGCAKHPSQLVEYVEAARAEPEEYEGAADYCWREEGTMNHSNGHFLCTDCYVKAGMPSSRRGWITP
jgi:hypothetical protein